MPGVNPNIPYNVSAVSAIQNQGLLRFSACDFNADFAAADIDLLKARLTAAGGDFCINITYNNANNRLAFHFLSGRVQDFLFYPHTTDYAYYSGANRLDPTDASIYTQSFIDGLNETDRSSDTPGDASTENFLTFSRPGSDTSNQWTIWFITTRPMILDGVQGAGAGTLAQWTPPVGQRIRVIDGRPYNIYYRQFPGSTGQASIGFSFSIPVP